MVMNSFCSSEFNPALLAANLPLETLFFRVYKLATNPYLIPYPAACIVKQCTSSFYDVLFLFGSDLHGAYLGGIECGF
jgi:hypothetical protein